MPRASTKRRRLILIAFSTPVALIAALWLATHLWFTWYTSEPSAPTAPGAARPPSIRMKIHAGAIHITDDATLSRATTPLKPGTVTLVTSLSINGKRLEGLSVRWYPTLPIANTWQLDMQPGNWRIPLYIPLIVLAALPVIYYTISRTTTPGHCTKCNYNRKGLASAAKCPECGHAPTST